MSKRTYWTNEIQLLYEMMTHHVIHDSLLLTMLNFILFASSLHSCHMILYIFYLKAKKRSRSLHQFSLAVGLKIGRVEKLQRSWWGIYHVSISEYDKATVSLELRRGR